MRAEATDRANSHRLKDRAYQGLCEKFEADPVLAMASKYSLKVLNLVSRLERHFQAYSDVSGTEKGIDAKVYDPTPRIEVSLFINAGKSIFFFFFNQAKCNIYFCFLLRRS